MKSAKGFSLIELLIVVAIIGIIAAIAIPALLAARASAHEAAAKADLKVLVSSNTTYYSANHNAYATNLQCLGDPPGSCPTPWAAGTLPFIDRQLGGLLAPGNTPMSYEKNGYRRTYAIGPVGAGAPDPGVVSFTQKGAPVSNQSGERDFQVDATGLVCYAHPLSSPVQLTNDGVANDAGCTPI